MPKSQKIEFQPDGVIVVADENGRRELTAAQLIAEFPRFGWEEGPNGVLHLVERQEQRDAPSDYAATFAAHLSDPERFVAKALGNAEQAASVMSALADAGFAVVPREPTDAMIIAGVQTFGGTAYSGIPSWRAMVAAATVRKQTQ